MTKRQAATKTKYFGEGVHAHIWCHTESVNWAISVIGNGGVTFYRADELRQSLLALHESIVAGREQLELRQPRTDGVYTLEFSSPDAAKRCITELLLALKHVQSVSKEEEWRDLQERSRAATK